MADERKEAVAACQHDAVLLHALLEGMGALMNEGRERNAVTGMVEIAIQRAQSLVTDLDAATT